MSTKSLLKSTGLIGLATALSRALGFVRLILMASFFGTGSAIQAFIVAFKIPNLLRDFVAEGAANSAFVPVLSEFLVTKKKEEYWEVANVLLNIVLIALMLIVITGVVIAPLIIRVVAPGFVADHSQFKLAVNLLRIMFPYILLVGLAAYAMGVLNSLKHFSAPAFAPCLLNLSIITGILINSENVNVSTLAYSVLVGGFLQLAIQVPVLYAKGMRLRVPRTLFNTVAKRIAKLLLPRLVGVTIYELNVLVDTILASLYWIVGVGAIAALEYSYRLVQFPTAIFGISLATAALPTLSAHFARSDMEAFKKTLNFSLRFLFLIMIPATAGIIAIGNHIVRILFQRGEFTAYSTFITNQALLFYALGLFSYAGIKILVFSFYSMQDTITPVKTAGISLAINVILNLILMWPLKLGGLALATSIAGVSNFCVLLYILRKRIGSFGVGDIASFLIKVAVASALMGLVLCITADNVGSRLLNINTPSSLLYLLLLIIAGAIVYFAALHALGVKEIGKFIKWALKRQ